MEHRVRAEALERTYAVVRTDRRHAAAAVRGGAELGRSQGRLGVDRVGLASAVLEDALGYPPSYKLASDLSGFLVPEHAGERTMTGHELQDWLRTWRPPFEQLFPLRDRKRSAR
ncbi:MAG: hypothetical protein JWN32_456 [Solirubrobacterales bacterium]|jgi:hypothetical protein|nr:hypothetical protein [Solirubrobacterales bacterium]